MAAMDISKSAFANARELVFETPAAQNGGWRVDTAKHLSALSRAAVVAVLLTVVAANLAHAVEVSTAPIFNPSQTSQVTQVEKTTKAPSEREAQIGALYEKGVANTDFSAWQSQRPNLKMFGMYNGVNSHDHRSLAEKVGMSAEDYASDKAQERVDAMDAEFKRDSQSERYAGVAQVMPISFFKTADKPGGAVCAVSFNVRVAETHEQIKAATGWTDDVVVDMVINHEKTHCLESGDRADLLMKEMVNPSIEAGSLVTAKGADYIKDSVGLAKRVSATDHPHEQTRMAFLNVLEPLSEHIAPRLNGEEIADSVALMGLIKQSRIEVQDIGKYANFRVSRWDKDKEHDTSSMLLNLQNQLELNPGLVKQWRQDHAQELAQGKSLQVSEQIAWVTPMWKAHAEARDDGHHQHVSPVVTNIPGYASVTTNAPQATGSDRTAGYFSSMFKSVSEKPSATFKP